MYTLGREARGKLSRFTLLTGLLIGFLPAVAAADGWESPPSSTWANELLTPYGEYFLVGGGLTNYFDRAVRDRVDLGGTWDLRLGIGNRFFVGAEAAYIGSALKAGGLGTNLVTNGAEGVLRIQYPYATGRWLIEPFAFGGAGWTHFDINSARVGQRGSDDVFETPVGGGVMLAYGHFLFDGRFTYRQTYSENLIQARDGTLASLKSWGVTASAGYEF
jgi:hypothetical protein